MELPVRAHVNPLVGIRDEFTSATDGIVVRPFVDGGGFHLFAVIVGTTLERIVPPLRLCCRRGCVMRIDRRGEKEHHHPDEGGDEHRDFKC